MIFDGRPLSEIEDSEIARLVEEHHVERQHLEFKATVNHKTDEGKLEILCDIAALTNGGGGYLFIGIRDDGRGRAQCYESDLLKEPDRLRRSLLDLCLEHIEPRIDGLEIELRQPDGHDVISIRVPSSARRPHMVKFQQETRFHSRYQDGKRAMILADIREAFVTDLVGHRLTVLEARMSDLIEFLHSREDRERLASAPPESTLLLDVTNGELLADKAADRFAADVGSKPFFWMAATPKRTARGLIDPNTTEIRRLLEDPPEQRRGGWTVETYEHEARRFRLGLNIGSKSFRYLELFENGHLEFWAPLDGESFCWTQTAEEIKLNPHIYPAAVCEYPVSFLRLVQALYQAANISGDIVLQLRYQNLRGFRLRPYRPGVIGYSLIPTQTPPYAESHLFARRVVPHQELGEKAALDLIAEVYAAFGYAREAIPCFDVNGAFLSPGTWGYG